MAAYKNRTTPGVYVTELTAFPPSIMGVPTAVPVFIGYTQQALISGKPVFNTPILINSLAAFQQIFGAGYEPKYLITETTGADYDVTGMKWVEDTADTTAGGAYVATNYTLTTAQAPTTKTISQNGTTAVVPVEQPPLATFNLYNSVRLFYNNGGGTCYVVSVDNYTNAVGTTGSANINPAKLTSGLLAAGEQVGPTIVLIPDAVLLTADTPPTESEATAATAAPAAPAMPRSAAFDTLTKLMLTECARLQDRVAVLDVYGTQAIDIANRAQLDMDITTVINNFQTYSVGEANLNYGMAYFPFLITSVVPVSEIDYTNFDAPPVDETTKISDNITALVTILKDQASYSYPPTDPANASPEKNDNATYQNLLLQIDAIPKTLHTSTEADLAAITKLNQNLVNGVPLLQQMENILAYDSNTLPASGAMAGIYTLNDATAGVWNAPANVVVNTTIKPSVPVNANQQGPINAPINGKSVNVIRDFVGRGPVVWGARTLDGNSRDYRYIQVRRTLVYIETSIKTALNQFVFAPNDGQTWVAVTAMVSAFLANVWAQGGLMGDKASDAFTVQCGLGSTMTGTDILDGYMIVQVTLQMIRPAEFIELTFKQTMQGVA